jgi:hypothetical protein
VVSGAWTPEKVAAVRAAFFEFLRHVYINSKNKGGNYCLADGVYDAQHRLLNAVFDGLADDIHDFKALKSRQLGITTIIEAFIVFYLGVTSGIQGAAILDTASHLKAARLRIKNIIKNLPKSLKYPAIVEDSRDMLVLANGSKISWMAAGVRETESSGGLGRSEGFNLVWGSEVSSWRNEEGIVSLIETLSETFPDRLYLWESTARGYNQWRDMWLEAQEDTFHQRTIFIGWWAHPDHVILKTDRRFAKYGSAEPTDEERTNIEKVRERYHHDITIEQLAWHRYKIDPTREAEESEKKGGQFKQQEQPTIEEECFTASGTTFFDYRALNDQALRITAQGKSKNFQYRFGNEFPSTIISPAIFFRDVQLRVWEEPQAGATYIVSGDPAYGRNPDNDRSAVQVLKCFADCIEQVAEFASPEVNTTQFAWVLMSLAAWYGNSGTGLTLIVELDGPGEAVWKEIDTLPSALRSPYLRQQASDRGLLDVFQNVRNFIFNRPDSMAGRGNNWQWKTGNRKEAIMEQTKALVATTSLLLRSMDLVEEMRKIARDGAAIEAPSHKHDDRVMALAIGVRAWYDEARRPLMAKGITRQGFLDAQKMTTQGRYDIYMRNQLSSMFHQKASIARMAAREARRAQISRRR